MSILIAQYRGKSLISKAIKWQTRSVWSHSAIVFPGYTLVEAWHIGGVRLVRSDNLIECLKANHSEGTEVDLFSLELEEDKAREFAISQVGKQYDYSLLFNFLTREPAEVNNKWICSELVAAACSKGGVDLQRLPAQEFSPQLVGISPLLKFKETVCLTKKT